MKIIGNNLSKKLVKADSIGDFKLTETFYSAEYQRSLHTHDYAYFCFVIEGDYTLKYEEKVHLCQSAKLLFFPAETDHACFMHTNSRCFNFRLNSQISEYFGDNKYLSADKIIQTRSEFTQLNQRLYQEFYAPDEFSPLTVEGLISEITAEFLRHTKSFTGKNAPNWLHKVKDLIAEDFINLPSLTDIAKISNVHPTHLAREFQRHFQITIGDFVRQKRVESACQKLIKSKVPLSEIAIETGFYDQSHFNRIFKKATGMTPLIYRKTFQNR
jgi:AraC family transcriptional regulator